MARGRKKSDPAYSRYHQWADDGKRYWEGVSLFNSLNTLPTLRHNLNRRESKNNRTKLEYLMWKHFRSVPAEVRHTVEVIDTSGEPPAARPQPVARGPQPVAATPDGVDIPWSDSRLKLPVFSALPDVLKQARIENMKRHRRACALHAALAQRNADPGDSGTIHFRDMLRMMGERDPAGTPVRFNLRGFTYNRKTKEGGRTSAYHDATLLVEDALPNPRDIDKRAAERKARAEATTAKHRPGDHFRNATRDLLTPDQEKHRVIIWTITHFNGMRVVLGSAPSHEPQATSEEQLEAWSLQLAAKTVRELVETMDAVCMAWDVERRFQQSGALPDVPEDLRAQFMKLPLHKLEKMITNSIRPKVSRWKRAADERDGDDLVEAQMALSAAESELALALEVVRMKEHAAGSGSSQ